MKTLRGLAYPICLALLWPVNRLLAIVMRSRFVPGSVLHVSYMVHVPYHAVMALRAEGITADYLAVGDSATWNLSDFQIRGSRWPWIVALREFRMLWSVVARYEIVHAHFMVTMTRTGWELPLLKRMGRKLVVHYRGCEARDRDRNMALHPACNICQECDYDPYPCRAPLNIRRRQLADQYGDAVLVTTPDMKDFVQGASHVRFFTPPAEPKPRRQPDGRFVIVHATNHPGIEGTRHIVAAVEALKQRGHAIDLQVLSGVTHERVLAALAQADVSIGKMKMGYYANLQVESLALGVPAITWVRPDLMTPDLADSGLIFATLDTLESTIEHYATHPDALAEKSAKARASVLRLHDNAAIARQLSGIYSRVTAGATS